MTRTPPDLSELRRVAEEHALEWAAKYAISGKRFMEDSKSLETAYLAGVEHGIAGLLDRLALAERRVERALEVLKWYADTVNWAANGDTDPGAYPVVDDVDLSVSRHPGKARVGGRYAREALREIESSQDKPGGDEG